ncbi:hypothetical protein LSUE1_G009137 [Lachnellula suecica]|uniref:DUF8004 domain-containing protein n=1 Tax=Lachnellula suecica TaxID=602035 RepID=A0A8T9C1Q3_9HELO|nr:hypothetical protein LSUE1_G009137 [Lachnellula suecica]
MSGRSAYVRKEKTKTKDVPIQSQQRHVVGSDHGSEKAASIYGEFPVPLSANSNGHHPNFQNDFVTRSMSEVSTTKTNRSDGSEHQDDLAYARVRKPHVPVIDVSGIEKSSFRNMMDKRSEGIRLGMAKAFGKKKKDEAERSETSNTVRPESHELDTGDYGFPPPNVRPRNQQFQESQEYSRPGPPTGKLPPIPPGPQVKRWTGGGRSPQPWNKLRKDPELWDPNGDTLIFFGQENSQSRPPPSFRISSRVLEDTQSKFLITLLREGAIDDMSSFNMPPSPVSSPGMHPAYLHGRGKQQPTPPMSDTGSGIYDGQISYEVYIPAPNGQNKTEILRHQLTTRNVFAFLYQASLVGLNLFQALNDLHERLEIYMPPDTDAAGMLIDYIASKGLDDVRNSSSCAAALLAWSESQGVRWEEGWREAYIHCAGMYHELENSGDFRFITPITKALLERGNLEMYVRVQSCEDRLAEFDFTDMWPQMSAQPPPARSAFERLQRFFHHYYQSTYQFWPPPAQDDSDLWLTRDLAQRLQKDFGALYDYLVNREVIWDCSEERSGRKWNIVHPGNRAFGADSSDMLFTDILVAFDNRHKYQHIPHPYPLTPELMPVKPISRENLLKPGKKSGRPVDDKFDKMAERRAALAYTESTNIYLLGSDFVSNDLVEAFVKFEKGDRGGDVDPYAARRGRWVLIYGILQSLASVSIDTPNMRFTNGVTYHLNPRLRGTPPWKGANQNAEEAAHVGSYCWKIPETWNVEQPVSVPRIKPLYLKTSVSATSGGAPSISESDTGSSIRSPTYSTRRRAHRLTKDSENSQNTSYSGYAPGIEKLDEWPIREHSPSRETSRGPSRARRGNQRSDSPKKDYAVAIKDFDNNYHF